MLEFALVLLVQLFEDSSAVSGLKGEPGAAVAFVDIDADGAPDVVVEKTKIFLNRGGKFVKAGELPKSARDYSGMQAGDVNGDGFPDLVLLRITDPRNPSFKEDGLRNELWIGDGKGGFTRKESGIETYAESSISACFLDYDRDGRLDLFVANAFDDWSRGERAHPSRLFRGRGDGTFEDVTEKAGLLLKDAPGDDPKARRPAFGVTHTDWDNDGWQDILVCTYGRQANRLWRNNRDGTFTDVAAETTFDGDDDRSGAYTDEVKELFRRRHGRPIGDEPAWRSHGNTFDAGVADVDGDGDMDVFLGTIQHWWAGPSSDRSVLLVNQGVAGGWKFKRAADAIRRVVPEKNWDLGDQHVGWLDVDNDGRLDLVIAMSDYPEGQYLRLWRQNGDGTFDDWTEKLGFLWEAASQISFGDFDRDGATDILVGTKGMRLPPEKLKTKDMSVGLWRNRAAAVAGNRFLSLRLGGRAVGARVTVVTGASRQIREVYGGLGLAGHRDDEECRFGVAKAERVDAVIVRWPDGETETFEDVGTNRHYALEKHGALRIVK